MGKSLSWLLIITALPFGAGWKNKSHSHSGHKCFVYILSAKSLGFSGIQ
jgi:hypothetical protein